MKDLGLQWDVQPRNVTSQKKGHAYPNFWAKDVKMLVQTLRSQTLNPELAHPNQKRQNAQTPQMLNPQLLNPKL